MNSTRMRRTRSRSASSASPTPDLPDRRCTSGTRKPPDPRLEGGGTGGFLLPGR
ncbi:hypothetical protein ACFFX0_07825 [Citricoccus parietis]|uniref:Uncharacterized protein n=1 Tax=Citricoccus parietis TaxID=592307 RepID=A0ABV5FXE7_9MICC